MDLPALDRQLRSRVGQAIVRGQAQAAVRAFAGAFQDPHLAVHPAGPAGGAPAEPQRGASCRSLGYERRDVAFRLPFPEVSGWQSLASALFCAGRLGTVGVRRIGHFGEDGYLDICEQAGADGTSRERQLRVRAALQAALVRTLEAFAASGATTVLVDVTRNGGGTEWAEAAAALFTAGPLTRRTPRRVVSRCDRTGIWRGEAVCPVLDGESLETTMGRGPWRGRVVVLADGRSASATEDFIVRLRESGVARLAGARTAGAGCGYVDDPPAVRLPAIGVEVRAPNCARFTSNGVNEVEGLTPDIAVPLEASGDRHAVAAVLAAIAAE